jgi:hypothetical protein
MSGSFIQNSFETKCVSSTTKPSNPENICPELMNEMTDLRISMKDELLINIFRYFNEKGYRFAIGETVEPVTTFEVIGKPFVPTITALILEKNETPSSDYTNVKFCESLDEILAAGKKMRNELIMFTLDYLVGCD